MGILSGIGRIVSGPLLLFNLFLTIIILGIAAHVLDKDISNHGGALSGFQGNGATPYLVLFSLIAGALLIAAYIAGLHHLWHWRSGSGGAAQATSWIAWLLLIIAFCLAWKQVRIGGTNVKLKVLESFIIILTFTHLLYTLAQYLGDTKRGAGGNNTGANTPGRKKFLNPNSPAAASAV